MAIWLSFGEEYRLRLGSLRVSLVRRHRPMTGPFMRNLCLEVEPTSSRYYNRLIVNGIVWLTNCILDGTSRLASGRRPLEQRNTRQFATGQPCGAGRTYHTNYQDWFFVT